MKKVVIPGEFPSLNEFIGENRRRNGSWNGGNAMKQRDQRILETYIRKQIPKALRAPCRLRYTYFCKSRKRDLDNISGYFHKVFQDALVSSGRLPDDNWKYIIGFSDDFELDRKDPRIEVLITEEA